jgi:hypothetical protein
VLRLRNTSSATCFVTGIPNVELLDARGRKLSTIVRPARPGVARSALILLAPGRSATATARFSPDVPGPGEGVVGPCERRAYRLRVRPGGTGSTDVPIVPPTSVCEHGRLVFSLWRHG